MAITTYALLQTAVANWLDRDDLTDRIPEFIALCEADMNRKLRVDQMLARDTASVNAEYAAVPTDFLEVQSLTMTLSGTTVQLDAAPPEVIENYAQQGQTGWPRFYSLVGDEFRFYPVPETTYTALLTYFEKIPALTSANTSNWVLASHPDAYLYGTLLQSAPFLRDAEAMSIYSAGYQAALDGIMAARKTTVGRLRTEVAALARGSRYDINRDF